MQQAKRSRASSTVSRTARDRRKAKRMLLFEQLGFVFTSPPQILGRDVALEIQARRLLENLGAKKLARQVCVEWNSRLRSAAGRPGYRGRAALSYLAARDSDAGTKISLSLPALPKRFSARASYSSRGGLPGLL